jgi:hypothetical protein
MPGVLADQEKFTLRAVSAVPAELPKTDFDDALSRIAGGVH